MHKITNLWTFELNRSSRFRDNNERHNNTLVTRNCVLSDVWFRDLTIYYEVSKSDALKINSFSKTTFTSEGAVSHNQQLPITLYQVKFLLIKFWAITNSVPSLLRGRSGLSTCSQAYKLCTFQIPLRPRDTLFRHLKAHVQQGRFSLIIFLQLWVPIRYKFHRFIV